MPFYKQLFIWVEGNDDERFFDKVIKPEFQKKYDSVKIIKYATMKKEKIHNYIKSIDSMSGDYIYCADINNAPCVTAKKGKIYKKFNEIDPNKTFIVIREIESWYLAGLDNEALKKLKVRKISDTDDISKEQFDKLKPKEFNSRIDFMLELLNNFSINEAKRKNKSFKYFWEKCF